MNRQFRAPTRLAARLSVISLIAIAAHGGCETFALKNLTHERGDLEYIDVALQPNGSGRVVLSNRSERNFVQCCATLFLTRHGTTPLFHSDFCGRLSAKGKSSFRENLGVDYRERANDDLSHVDGAVVRCWESQVTRAEELVGWWKLAPNPESDFGTGS